jgi:hypothetical protein
MKKTRRSQLAKLWNLATAEDFKSAPVTARCTAFVTALESEVKGMGGGSLFTKDTPEIEHFKNRWFTAWKQCRTDEEHDRCFFFLLNCGREEREQFTKTAEKIREGSPLAKAQLACSAE